MPRAVWKRIFGSWTGPCGFYSVKWVKWSKGSGRRSPSAACPAPNAKQWRQSPATFTGIERACNMTNTSLTGGPLPVVRSKARARTSSKTAWSAPGCAGPSRWLSRSSNSEPSTSPETLIATGNSTSSRINSGYIRPTGPSFQSSRTLLKLDPTGKVLYASFVREVVYTPAVLPSGTIQGITEDPYQGYNVSRIDLAATPKLNFSCPVNGASWRVPDGLAPGEIVSIFGSNLGPEAGAMGQLEANGRVSSSLAGTQVLFMAFRLPCCMHNPGRSIRLCRSRLIK